MWGNIGLNWIMLKKRTKRTIIILLLVFSLFIILRKLSLNFEIFLVFVINPLRNSKNKIRETENWLYAIHILFTKKGRNKIIWIDPRTQLQSCLHFTWNRNPPHWNETNHLSKRIITFYCQNIWSHNFHPAYAGFGKREEKTFLSYFFITQ